MPDRDLLMIPGPIEFEPDVLRAMADKTASHVSPEFVEIFGRALDRMRQVWLAPDGQPFVVAGSGTLAMEMAAANLVQPGDRALVINTGYFSDRMAAILVRHGAVVTQVPAPIGTAPAPDEIAHALASDSYKVLVVTHVETSTGVRAPVEPLVRLARQHGALSIVDGVCSTAAEVFRQADWDADVFLTASQKAIGVPPGLALLVASPRAMETWRARRTPVASVYLDFAEWLPIMEAYMARKPAYFATPPVNLIYALDVSLGQILAEGMEARFARHARIGRAFRAAWQALDLSLVPLEESLAANTLSAIYYPSGADATLLAGIKQEGVIVAGGLHPEIRTRYFRVGHMGAITPNDVLATVGAVERALLGAGSSTPPGTALAAAQAVLSERE
ncbi:MAG TPA: alanine--glyoxylate aminotransferase family protein [Ardenticatenaceae bacterium]|nr:alanine--glyoxylate aminotransferase family protein [Ardenticatenaceae bacterium]